MACRGAPGGSFTSRTGAMDERCKVYSDEYPLGFVICGSPAEAEAIGACLGVGRVETGRSDRRAEKKIQDAADRAAAKRAKMSKGTKKLEVAVASAVPSQKRLTN